MFRRLFISLLILSTLTSDGTVNIAGYLIDLYRYDGLEPDLVVLDGNYIKSTQRLKHSSPALLKPSTIILLLRLYSLTIASTSSSLFLKASMAAYWAVVGEHIMAY